MGQPSSNSDCQDELMISQILSAVTSPNPSTFLNSEGLVEKMAFKEPMEKQTNRRTENQMNRESGA